ncbi:MAG: T9SS type A sorting domain-containing protein [Bacteroidota bacterium]
MEKLFSTLLAILATQLCVSTNLQAQRLPLITVITTDAGDPYGGPPCYEEMRFGVTVANLDLFPENFSSPQDSYVLPSTHDPMYIRVTLDGNPQTHQLTNFRYYTTENSIEYFIADVVLRTGVCKDNSDVYDVDWQAELLTINGSGGYTHYPMCAYAAPGDIFACDAIPVMSGSCPNANPPNPCYDHIWSVRSGNQTVNCSICYPDEIDPNAPKSTNGRSSTTEQNSHPMGFTATPNPFTNQLQIQIEKHAELRSLTLYNVQGQKIRQWQATNDQNAHWMRWNTSNLPTGSYILQAHFDDNSHASVKIVKH